MSTRGRGVALALAIAVVALGAMMLLGAPAKDKPLDPHSDESAGTSALVVLLRELGAKVDLDVGHPDADADVALMLRDQFNSSERSRLKSWTRQGHVLVVTDPSSPLNPPVQSFANVIDDNGPDDPADTNGDQSGFDLGIEVRPGDCDIAPLDDPDINYVEVFGGPVDYEVDRDAQSCFGDGPGGSAYVVATPEGEGTIVAIGGSGIILNRSLGDGDNAPVIAALLAPRDGTRVAVLDPGRPTIAAAGQGNKTLWGLVPPGVKLGLLQVGLAFLIYVFWRVRRLGKPVAEPQPVKVAGSELVSAVGGLLERSKSPQHAADVMRADLRRDLILHLGIPHNLADDTLGQVLAARTGLDEARLQAALGPGPVTSDRDLLAVAQLIDYVRKEAFDHVGTGN